MHALNVIFMLAEFALNGLLVEAPGTPNPNPNPGPNPHPHPNPSPNPNPNQAWHLGLVVAWVSLCQPTAF